jgi:hypothetical protein
MVSELNAAISPSVSMAAQQQQNLNGRIYENMPHSSVSNQPANIMSSANAQNGGDPSEKKKKVGNYIISKTIGEGSFAKVRLGYHLITQHMVISIGHFLCENSTLSLEIYF